MPSVSSLLDSINNNEQISNTTDVSGGNSTNMQPEDVGKVTQQIIDKQDTKLKPSKAKKRTSQKVVKPQDFDLEVAQTVYRGVQSILEKDEFDLFATKSSKSFDLKIAKINTEIEKLIQLNTKAKTDEEKFHTKLAQLKKENDKKMGILREKLA